MIKRSYPKYKSSGVNWLGDIPNHWEVLTLRRHLVHIKDGTHGSFERVSEGYPLLSAKNIYNGMINIGEDESLIAENDWKEIIGNGFPKKGDILLTIVGTIGRTAVFDYPIPIAFQRSVAFLRMESTQYPSFIRYGLESAWFQAQLNSVIKTSAQGGTYMEDVIELKFAFPAPDEQKIIADFLDRETARMDSLIEKKQRQIELLQEKRAAIISHAVTKGLNPDAKMKDSGIEWLGKIPEHWKIGQLRRVIENFVDYRGKTPEKVESGIPLVTAKNIKKGQIDYSLSHEYIKQEDYEPWMVRGLPEKGDVLVTTEAPLGETAQIDEEEIALAQRVILLKSDSSLIINEYLMYCIMSRFGQGELWSRATGSTAIGIKAYHFKESLVLIPPIEEQEAIVSHITNGSNAIGLLILKIEASLALLMEYRTSIISAAVTGKIDVREIE